MRSSALMMSSDLGSAQVARLLTVGKALPSMQTKAASTKKQTSSTNNTTHHNSGNNNSKQSNNDHNVIQEFNAKPESHKS